MKHIYLPKELKTKLLQHEWTMYDEKIKINRMTLNRALKFESNSKLAEKLREKALEMGGILYEDKR